MTLQRGQKCKLGTDVGSHNCRARRQAGSTLQFRNRIWIGVGCLRACNGAKESCSLVHKNISLITSDSGSQNINKLKELIIGIC